MATIRQVKEIVDRGWSVSEAVGHVVTQNRVEPGETFAVSDAQAKPSVEELLDALLGFDRSAADAVMKRLEATPIEQVIAAYYRPLMTRIGEGWLSGEYTVAQEHFASGFVRDQLTATLLRLGCGPVGGRVAVCCCYPDDQHELGLLMVAIRLALRSWRITWLGQRMPEDALVEFIGKHPPSMLCVSITLSRAKGEIEAYASRLRSAIPDSVDIVLGGPGVIGVNSVPGVRFLPDPGIL